MERLTVKPAEETELARFLHARVVGQEAAVASIVGQHNKWLAGMNDPSLPISTTLFLGPTGVGKTKLVEAYCEYLFGENQKPLVVNCGEFQQDHQIAALIGSPAGYIGSEQKPRLHSDFVEKRVTTNGKRLQVILFDEIEKAVRAGSREFGQGGGSSSALFTLMLSILDRATLTMSAGSTTNFGRTIIFMTSNLGAAELQKYEQDFEKMRVVAEKHAQEFFSPEQYNRISETVVFKSLDPAQIALIMDLEIAAVAERANIEIDLDDVVRERLVAKSYDIRYGARELKRGVDKFVTRILSSFMASGDIVRGNRVRIEMDENDSTVAFYKLQGMASVEEKKPAVAPPTRSIEERKQDQFKGEGYVRRMMKSKFKYGDSHGAKIYQWYEKNQFPNNATPERILLDLQTAGWTTSNADPLAAVKYVLADWMKKGWADRDHAGRYTLKP